MSNDDKDIIDTVQVALRIRPLVESEKARGCVTCLETFPSQNQVQVKGLAFTYNYVFPPEIGQITFYETSVANMVKKLFKGYNVTILAYGQTGSGKTYSMGTCYTGLNGDASNAGIIPQAVGDIFDFVETNSEEFDFKVTVSFMELYQEQLFDLLSSKPREQNIIDIREDHRGIVLPGLSEEKVSSAEDTMECLVRGSSGRATGATAMNAQSSRSHAIFTVQIVKESKLNKNQITTSKFHLVDLAGSERSKKTKATGNRFKEGVKINQGLLALGNVISALGDGTTRGFICYRESKLTRLLQDSLGGNSITLMIACVSPADYNLDETVSTLRYADRAKQIRNKPIINQDAKGAEIIKLNNLVQQLRLQLLNEGGSSSQDSGHLLEELEKLKHEHTDLIDRYEKVVDKNKNLSRMLQESLSENTNIFEKVLLAEAAKDKVDRKLTEITEECNQTIDNLNKVPDTSTREEALQSMCEMRTKIMDLQNQEQRQCGQLIQQLIQDDGEQAKTDSESTGEEYVSASPDLNESDITEKEEAHALEQVSRNHQLQDLVKSLALKISLAEKLSANNEDLDTHNQNVKEYEERINKLEEEKDKLLMQLKVTQHKSKLDPKVADERRGRIQGLETEISSLRKKCQEQANFLKMKEKNDLKIVSLNKEIIQMKATKVKLIKTMQQENSRFRTWRIQNERKIAKLCDQDRKRQNEMVRMEIKHGKQQNVLKRKMEEAVAINKRLKEVLERQKTAHKQRSQHPVKAEAGKTEAILQWVEQELEVVKWMVAAERHLEGLMEDRGAYTEQLENRRARDPQDPELPALQEEIAQRNAQIAELQEKILTGDQDQKIKSRWDTVQTMSEAKHALKYLFEVTVETKREVQNYKYKNMQEDTKFEELKSVHKETINTLNELENKLKQLHFEHKKELSQVEKQNEERICTLLRQLNGTDISTPNDQLMERINILEEVSQNAIRAKNDLEKENEELHKELEAKKSKQRKIVKKSSTERVNAYLHSEEEDDSDNDHDNDPDWKATPIMRRFGKSRTVLKEVNKTLLLPVKRSSDGQTKCSCKGTCGSKLCSCRKFNMSCGSRCKCNSTSCVNKDNSDVENQSSGANIMDTSEECNVKCIQFTEPSLEPEPLSKNPIFRQDSDETELVTPSKKRNKSFFYGEGKSEI